MEGPYWGVFLVNPKDDTDRKLVSATFDNERDVATIADDLNGIVERAAIVAKAEDYSEKKRIVRLDD